MAESAPTQVAPANAQHETPVTAQETASAGTSSGVSFSSAGPIPAVATAGVAGRAPTASERAYGTTGTVAAPPTEQLFGHLWAKDDKGNDLAPSVDDIGQGGLNDCYIFAALSAIVAADPQRIKQMIQDNANGTYTVFFKGTGLIFADSQTVTADFVKGRHATLGGRAAWWPLIIEKAYAQEKGGLDKINTGGNPGDAVKDFTNLGATHFDPRTKDSAWLLNTFVTAHAKKQPIEVVSPKKDEATTEKREMSDRIKGLRFWHSYGVVDVDDKGKRVKLYNPWGHTHPNGDGWVSIDVIRDFFIDVDINS